MEVEKEEVEIGYFAEEIKLMKDKVLEKNLLVKELKNIDKELITKITDICFENILKTYKGRNKVNAALLYLKDLYDKNYISENLYNKFLEFEEFRRIKKKKKFNTIKMVDLILKKEFKIKFEDYPEGLPSKLELHIIMCIDVTIGRNYMGIRSSYVSDADVLKELRERRKEETKFVNILPVWD